MSSASATVPSVASGGFSEAAFEAFSKGRDEPQWLRDRRREAFEVFRATPLPTARDEEWRRTDIRGLKLDTFAPPPRQEPSPEARAAIEPAWTALSTHYATGIEQVNAATSRKADPAKLGGAVFLDLATAVKDHPELLKRYLLTDAVTPREDAFSALHAAFWTGGTPLFVPQRGEGEGPPFSPVGPAPRG